MIKAAFYDAKEYDKPSFEKYGQTHDIQFSFLETKLTCRKEKHKHSDACYEQVEDSRGFGPGGDGEEDQTYENVFFLKAGEAAG